MGFRKVDNRFDPADRLKKNNKVSLTGSGSSITYSNTKEYPNMVSRNRPSLEVDWRLGWHISPLGRSYYLCQLQGERELVCLSFRTATGNGSC